MKDYKIGRYVNHLGQRKIEYKLEHGKIHRSDILDGTIIGDGDVVLGHIDSNDKFNVLYRVKRRPVDVNLVARIVCNFINTYPYVLLKEKYEDISIDDLNRESRYRHIVVARQLSQFLLKIVTFNPTAKLEHVYGGSHRANIVHAINTILMEMDTNDMFRDSIPELLDSIINPKECKTNVIQHNFNICQI